MDRGDTILKEISFDPSVNNLELIDCLIAKKTNLHRSFAKFAKFVRFNIKPIFA